MVEHHLLIHQGPLRWMEGVGGETGKFGRFGIDEFVSCLFIKAVSFLGSMFNLRRLPHDPSFCTRFSCNLAPSSTPEPWLC